MKKIFIITVGKITYFTCFGNVQLTLTSAGYSKIILLFSESDQLGDKWIELLYVFRTEIPHGDEQRNTKYFPIGSIENIHCNGLMWA